MAPFYQIQAPPVGLEPTLPPSEGFTVFFTTPHYYGHLLDVVVRTILLPCTKSV